MVSDGDIGTRDNGDQQAQYREARLEPGDSVHVANGRVGGTTDGRGAGVTALVGAQTDSGFTISQGTESSVVRKHHVRFATGTVIGAALLALGLHAAGVVTLV